MITDPQNLQWRPILLLKYPILRSSVSPKFTRSFPNYSLHCLWSQSHTLYPTHALTTPRLITPLTITPPTRERSQSDNWDRDVDFPSKAEAYISSLSRDLLNAATHYSSPSTNKFPFELNRAKGEEEEGEEDNSLEEEEEEDATMTLISLHQF